MPTKTIEKEGLVELASEGYLYSGTAPRWVNGRGYFYLVNPEKGSYVHVSVECSRKEFRELRKIVEGKMVMMWGKKYYTGKKQRGERRGEGRYENVYEAVNKVTAQYLEKSAKRLEFIRVLEDLGVEFFFEIAPYLNIPPRKMVVLIKEPERLKEAILRRVGDLIEARHNADKLVALEEENKKLREENRALREKIEEQSAEINELKVNLSTAVGMFTPRQKKRYRRWLKIKKESKITFTDSLGNNIEIQDMPLDDDETWMDEFMEVLRNAIGMKIILRELESKSNDEEIRKVINKYVEMCEDTIKKLYSLYQDCLKQKNNNNRFALSGL